MSLLHYHIIDRCRVCKNPTLVEVLSLGNQCLTGIFPQSPTERICRAPLELVRCHGQGACGLVQLRHSVDLNTMYGLNYGYRSSLNSSMVHHLKLKVENLSLRVALTEKDLVLDIGSNDGTLLSFYPPWVKRVGMDPTIIKFGSYYAPGIHAIPEFYSDQMFQEHFGDQKAKIITSIAMFYDLEDPLRFAQEIQKTLAPDGIWHFEQSYLPSMLENNSYDTICHEHLEYYGLHQIQWILERCQLRILNVELNSINGGSFAVTACHHNAPYVTDQRSVTQLLARERAAKLDTPEPYEQFKNKVFAHRQKLLDTLEHIRAKKQSVLGYGASTKGNVILQFCNLTKNEIPAIAEVNADKFGGYTPGTCIPIISEKEALKMNPDFLLVMPWHFRDHLITRERDYLNQGGLMIFPLPSIEIVNK
ncbi:MAG: methyltransferase [Verrucomicrobia bacterium]|nr:MAG: methyltransferase [Verrucomicrobiota bacterium]